MFCKKCGYKLEDDSLFCSKCGADLRGSQPLSEQAKEAEPEKVLSKSDLEDIERFTQKANEALGKGMYFENEAEDYAKKILGIDPTNTNAYKLLIDITLRRIDQWKTVRKSDMPKEFGKLIEYTLKYKEYSAPGNGIEISVLKTATTYIVASLDGVWKEYMEANASTRSILGAIRHADGKETRDNIYQYKYLLDIMPELLKLPVPDGAAAEAYKTFAKGVINISIIIEAGYRKKVDANYYFQDELKKVMREYHPGCNI